MGCAHMASDGCVRVAHGRALRGIVALRLDRFEIFNLKFSVYVILINFKINILNYFLGF